MPWQEVSTVQSRTEFVALAEHGGNIRQLCRRFGISPTTAYKWLDRHRAGADLADRSRRPMHSPQRVEASIEQAVLALRHAHPSWGARKLKRRLTDQGNTLPAASTVHAILVRQGCISAHASEAATPFQRFEHPAPNDLWQMDFKGHFALNEGRCHPLTVLDDHSRYSLCLAACMDESAVTVRQHLIATFRRYGVPRRMTMDNGSPWGDTGNYYTTLEVWLMKQNIAVSHSRPYHPQTQGKDERFHRTLKAEVLQGLRTGDQQATQRALDTWQHVYNHERPHEALALDVPAQHYRASSVEYRDQPTPPEYDDPKRVRRVQNGGWIHWAGHTYRVGTAFTGEPVALRRLTDDRYLDVYWSTRRIAQINLVQHASLFGRKLP
jgi:transposase InsO family protein